MSVKKKSHPSYFLFILTALSLRAGDSGQLCRPGESTPQALRCLWWTSLRATLWCRTTPTSFLVPASILKCVTTASLMDKVGTDFRYLTPVHATGRVRDGILEGT